MKTQILTGIKTELDQLKQVDHVTNKKTVIRQFIIVYDNKPITVLRNENEKNWFVNLFLVSFVGVNVSRLNVVEKTFKK